jgi:hypothetical protein
VCGSLQAGEFFSHLEAIKVAKMKSRHETSLRSAWSGGVDAGGSKGPASKAVPASAPTRDGDGVGIDLEDFAADMGRFLGTVQNRAQTWLQQRQAIAEQLTQIRDTANEYQQRLTGAAADMAVALRRGRRGRPPGPGKVKGASGRNNGRRGWPKLSAVGRGRIADAQRKRWAKLRREQ